MGTLCLFKTVQPARVGGGVPLFVKLLMVAPGWPETGLEELSLSFFQDGPPIPGQGPADWARRVAALPKCRFDRKRRRLKVELRGAPEFDFTQRDFLGDMTPEGIAAGARMISRALTDLQPGLAGDGVDLSPLIRRAEALAARAWPDAASLHADLRAADALDEERRLEMDPWSCIDLRGAHRKARNILDQPVDWSGFDAFAPHGNDMGSDILAAWTRVKGQSVAEVAAAYSVFGPLKRVQLVLALAMAHVKKTATCPPDLAAEALATLRTLGVQAEADIAEVHHAAWRQALSRYEGILAGLAA